jgi:hypothetical protein
MSAAEYWMHAATTLAQVGGVIVGAVLLLRVMERVVAPVWRADEYYPRFRR